MSEEMETETKAEESTTETTPVVEEKHGIEHIKPLVALMGEIINVGEDFTKKDFMAAIDLADEFYGLTKVDFDKVIVQFKDIDSLERKELIAQLSKKIDLENDKVDQIIDAVLASVEDCFVAYKSIESVIQRVKAIKG